RPADAIGKKAVRNRVLNDDELRALWKATEDMGYPYGPLLRLLALTGQRRSEVAEAQWSEFDLAKRLWTIPAERMKADAAHEVPLSADAIAILESLPRFTKGDFLFSTKSGRKPINAFSRAKRQLDTAMLAQANANKTKLPPFVMHDIRR